MDRLSALPLELLDLVCQFVQLCGAQHIASLRSCNHCLADAASQYLFSVLVMGTRKRLLRRIRWVAARPQFAKGVREIEYDVTRYHCHTNTGRSQSRREWLSSLELDSSWMPTLHSWWNLCHDQLQLLKMTEVENTLVFALPYFPHVRSATISNRDVALRCQRSLPSYAIGIWTSADQQLHGYDCLLRVFSRSPHELKEFSVFPQNLNDGEMISAFFLLHSPEREPAIQATFEHLTIFRLESAVGCLIRDIHEVALEATLKTGFIARLLGYATKLRQVLLTFLCSPCHINEVPFLSVIGEHRWGSLGQIELDGVDIQHATDFCEFLNRHSNTITTITLRNINLMEGQWITVADCLRDLPGLCGLLLEGLEVGSCEYLDCVTIMEITDHAMGGRRNNLISDMDTLLGALNTY